MVKGSSNGMAYTRNKYIPGAPPSKIRKFIMGDVSAEFEFKVSMKALETGKISHNALEATRVAANKVLMENLGAKGYRLQIRVFPHLITRSHKFMAFAGADRLSEGMRRAYGKPTGRKANVAKGQTIIVVDVNENGVQLAKKALRLCNNKLPIKCQIVIEKTKK